jgi:hypothetical protein
VEEENSASMVETQKSVIRVFLIFFLISVALRLAMVIINRQANDNHMEVVSLILSTKELPIKADCEECFSPKLYHGIVALAIQAIGWTKELVYRQTVVAQFINFLAGIVTLAIAGIFILGFPIRNDRFKIVSFALVAFNPPLIGISSQATNDAFAILFSTAAIYLTYVYFQKQKPWILAVVLLMVLLGISSKTNAWVTAAIIAAALAIRALVQKGPRIKNILAVVLFLILVLTLSILNPLNQWITNARVYGSPILLNIPKPPPPDLFQQTSAGKPGILSVADGFFTFKFISLMEHPRNENDFVLSSAPFRTSLWTELYASAHSIHFINWPSTWFTSGDQDFFLTRGIFLLAFLPTLLLLIGALMEAFTVCKSILKMDRPTIQSKSFGLFALTFFGYLLFLVIYAYQYRQYGVMKAIFIYPGLLSFPVLFWNAWSYLEGRISNQLGRFSALIPIGTILLCLFYTLDVVTMIIQLYWKKKIGA